MLSGSSLFVAPAHIPELTKCKNLGWMADLGWCGGWDLNPRTPTGQGPEPCAFDLSWQPPRERETGICFDKCLSYFASLQLKGRGLYPSFENPRPYPGHRRHFCQMGN